MINKINKLIEIFENSVEYAEKNNLEVVNIRFTKDLANIFRKMLKEFVLDYVELEEKFESLRNENQILTQSIDDTYSSSQDIISELKEKNKSVKKELDKAISENKVKSIQFRQKNEIQNSMIFNQIACILENIRKRFE